jgi:hypothetical protein
MSVDVPLTIIREEAGRAYVCIFSFHAKTGDVVVDPNSEYFRETVLTYDSRDLAIYECPNNLMDFIHGVVPQVQTLR